MALSNRVLREVVVWQCVSHACLKAAMLVLRQRFLSSHSNYSQPFIIIQELHVKSIAGDIMGILCAVCQVCGRTLKYKHYGIVVRK